MTEQALFIPGPDLSFTPTSFAVGPWDPELVHGAAIAALFAGRLEPDDERTLGRLTVEILSPVPMSTLRLTLSEAGGGSRVQRRSASLTSGDTTVATASAVIVRRAEMDLPDPARRTESPFAADQAPALDRPYDRAAQMVGWESFDSQSLVLSWHKVDGDPRPHQWISLAVPVVAGSPLTGVEIAAVAADYAQTAVSWLLPFADWSFRNAELTLHLSREPVGRWVGIRSEAVADEGGAGFTSADLFDEQGRVAHTSSTIVVEPRQRA